MPPSLDDMSRAISDDQCYRPLDQEENPTTTPKLRALTPVAVDVEWSHSAPTTLARLLRVEHIDILRADSKAYCPKNQEYIVNIYYFDHPPSHIPTVIWNPCYRPIKTIKAHDHRPPDHHFVHTVSQFCSLRNILHSYVPTDYRSSTCEMCQELGRFMRSGGGRPMAFGALTMDGKMDGSVALSRFINYLVGVCRLTPAQCGHCRKQHFIAAVLYDFLFRC